MLNSKIFWRLFLFVILYVAYLCAFSYLSNPPIIGEERKEWSQNYSHKKQRKVTDLEDKICINNGIIIFLSFFIYSNAYYLFM